MRRSVAEMSLEENRAEHVRARQTAHMDIEEPQPEAGSGLRQPEAPVSGYVEILNYNEEGNNREPYERIREASLKKDQDLQSHRKDKQSANLQNLVLERIDARIHREEAIEKAYAQLATLKKHVEELSQADRQARAELIDSIKRKNLLRQKNADKNSELRHEQKKRLSEESKNHNNEKQKEIEAKQLLNEIIKLKQNHEEVGKRIDKLKQDRESHKLKVQKDESAARKAEEKEEIKRRLEGLVLRIAEKNKLFSKEYLSVRVLNEQVSRLKHHARVLAVLVPKENVANPFLLQTYLKVSKQHKNLSVLNNEKILHPEKHALTDLEDRVGNVEMYAQGVGCSEIIEKIIDKGSNKSVVAPLRKSAPRKAEIDFNDIVSLENSEEEDEDAAEIVGTTINLAENQRGVNESVLPAGKKLSENAVHLAKLLAPDPVKVFNDALILKKSTKRQAQPGGQTTCRFDQIIANDYISTYFDNNVAIRLYFELEILIKSLLYRNFDRVLQKVTFYSDEYRKILNSDGQRSNFNLHYHTEGALPDVNELLHSKVVDNSKANVKVVSVEGFSVSEADIKKAKFINYVLPQGRGDSMPLQADNKEPEKGANVIVFSGYKNYGLLPALLRIVYEETGAFDNHVVSVTRVHFSVEIHTEENFLGTYWVTAGENFDNFVDFIRYFDGQCTKRLYNDLLVIRYSYEIGSKLDPMFSSKKDLVFVVLPYLCDSKFVSELRQVLRQQQLPHEALKESLVAQDIFYGAQGHSIVVEMSNHITLSKDAPLKFEKYRLLVDFMSTLTRD